MVKNINRKAKDIYENVKLEADRSVSPRKGIEKRFCMGVQQDARRVPARSNEAFRGVVCRE
ncbi:hypothetical protein PORCRE_1479 [Porphyromonas crevioricanis JCM 15906]|uniref:Uncharacterized protein n=1 Tax=Porphyromonas crevioricanis JCM 15906 TaxID=1305617 RepID=T1CI67_9PORP|nr:hypothetical protein PORCRE_1479 [Porphyromonas crevioricanis JCM 15906]GAD06968.1 hypothetical protein PORCAN_579 [Porphyromonas crevioricanis JCM 13913]